MNNSKIFFRRSQTIDLYKENKKRETNLPMNNIKTVKRKPKLMPNNKIMQKLFPNFQTMEPDKSNDLNKCQPISFRKVQYDLGEEKMFKRLLDHQREKYETILSRHLITERPEIVEINEFLAKGKTNSLQTHRI